MKFRTMEERRASSVQGDKRIFRVARRKISGNEHEMQTAFIQWALISEPDFPQFKYLYSIPNAAASQSKQLVAEGVKSGVPDLHLAWPSGRFHSLYIEFKSGTYKLSDTQLVWRKRLEDVGHFVGVCRSLDSAKNLIVLYVKNPEKLG